MKRGLLVLAFLAIWSGSANASYVLMDSLYDDCAGLYVPPQVRTPEQWIALSQCSNYIDSVLLDVGMPESVLVARPEGDTVTMVCPRPDSMWKEDNTRVFEPSEFIGAYLRFWDMQNSDLARYTNTASNSILKAFKPRYAPCFQKAASKSK